MQLVTTGDIAHHTSVKEESTMAYRDRNKRGKSDFFDFCIMEVLLSKKGATDGAKDQMRLMTVDNHLETLRFVQNNMDACIGNIVRLKRIEDHDANS
jgi:hypothetical protein